jgi:hypothetical protein
MVYGMHDPGCWRTKESGASSIPSHSPEVSEFGGVAQRGSRTRRGLDRISIMFLKLDSDATRDIDLDLGRFGIRFRVNYATW